MLRGCLLGALVFGAGTAWPSDAEPTIQLNVRTWTAAEGAPAGEHVVQSQDGILWIASKGTLSRFDGTRFVRYSASSEDPPLNRNISTLATWPDGALWMGFTFGGVAALKDGKLTQYGERDGLPIGSVLSIFKDRDGSVWASARAGMARLRGARWEEVPLLSESRVSFWPNEALFDRSGRLWVLSADALYMRAPRPAAVSGHHQAELSAECVR